MFLHSKHCSVLAVNGVQLKPPSVTLVHGDGRDAERQEGKHGELEPHAASNTARQGLRHGSLRGRLMYGLAACRKGQNMAAYVREGGHLNQLQRGNLSVHSYSDTAHYKHQCP
jgi:hypothetical protein